MSTSSLYPINQTFVCDHSASDNVKKRNKEFLMSGGWILVDQQELVYVLTYKNLLSNWSLDLLKTNFNTSISNATANLDFRQNITIHTTQSTADVLKLSSLLE